MKIAAKIWLLRAAMLAGLAVFLLLVYALLTPLDLGWIAYVLLALALAFIAAELVLRRGRRGDEKRDWSRWRDAMHEPRTRLAALREVQQKLGQAKRLGARTRVRQARYAVLLAELHRANGSAEHALSALAAVALEALPPLSAAVVRLARAEAYLYLGDAESASVALHAIRGSLGDPAIDASVELCVASSLFEQDDLHNATVLARPLEIVASVSERAEPGDELHDEALALSAAILDALGRSEESAAERARLTSRGRARLALVGSRRVRETLHENVDDAS